MNMGQRKRTQLARTGCRMSRKRGLSCHQSGSRSLILNSTFSTRKHGQVYRESQASCTWPVIVWRVVTSTVLREQQRGFCPILLVVSRERACIAQVISRALGATEIFSSLDGATGKRRFEVIALK